MLAMLVTPTAENPLLTLREVPTPTLRSTEVLVRTDASGVNRADLLQRAGAYEQPALARGLPYTVGGMEVTGKVVARGADVSDLRVGDRVMAMCGGSFAEYAAVDGRLALSVPDEVSDAEAAALPVAVMTAYDALVRNALLGRRDTVLVTAATSAVGMAAVQLARLLGARRVLATTRRADHAPLLRDLGAHQVLVTPSTGASEALSEVRPDIVVDHVGGDLFPTLIAILAPGGRYVSVGRLGGQRATIDLNLLAQKRLSLYGATFRSRSLRQYAAIARQVRRDVLPAIGRGALRPVMGDRFGLAETNEALDSLRTPGRAGKITITVGETA